jgi:hypothetical protein
VNVGTGLVQQFTAVAVPDIAPQTFTWACNLPSGAACATGTLVQDANVSGLAVFTAPTPPPAGCTSTNCVQVTATSTIDATGVGKVKVTVLSSRTPAGTYAFRFSGYDNSNNAVALAGTVTFGANGTVISGVEDEVIATGSSAGPHQFTVASGSYVPSSASDHNTNNAGTLTLNAPGASVTQFQAVLDATGDIRIIESDGNGTGSGVMEELPLTTQFNSAPQKFVFGFAGVDSNGKRVGYAGLLPLDGNGAISGGLLDANDNGTTANVCGAPPCNVTGTYLADAIPGLWHMTLTTATTFHFDFFVSVGQTGNAANPLTLYAISTDGINATHPALSGTMVFQDPNTTYDKTALNAPAVAHLTGVDSTGSNTLVSLVLAAGDGNGNVSGTFDANNAGTIVAAQNFTCTYTTGTGGRYVVTLLGNGSTCTAPALPFVFYASGANRGFLLDQSSAAVLSGAMDPQSGSGLFAPSELPSTYAAATESSATSAVIPIAANLLLTSPGNQVFNVSGTQYPGQLAVTGAYTLTIPGTGTIALAAPAANYVMYAIDTSHFEMINVDASVKSASVILAQQ